MDLATIAKYWQQVQEITADLQSEEQFSTPEIIEYLNEHLPADSELVTKTKINYLRTQGILHPLTSGGGVERINWRYTIDDARRALLIELLKMQEDLSVQESKGWLRSFEETKKRGFNYSSSHDPHTSTQGLSSSQPPTSGSSAYSLLRNRVLGTVILALGFEEGESIPADCLIAIRPVKNIEEGTQLDNFDWDQACDRFENAAWFLAASDSYSKLYIYRDLAELQNRRTELTEMFHQHYYCWYFRILQDIYDQYYELILGLPQPEASGISPRQRQAPLLQVNSQEPIQLTAFAGLSTLLRAAFIHQPEIKGGTPLAALVEIIAAASDSWDYCAVLTPRYEDDGLVRWLQIKEYSSEFPLRLKDKQVEVGTFLTGWCYRYNQSIVVDSTIENDLRIAFFEEEGNPVAAAAIPATTSGQRVVGAIYVAKRGTNEEGRGFSKEVLTSLEAFGYMCGDMIARDRIEIETVRSTSRLSIRPLVDSFPGLKDLLQRVVDEVDRRINPETALHSWVYLLTLNIEMTSQDPITQWLCQQVTEITGKFLANCLWAMPRYDLLPTTPYHDPLPVGMCKLGPDQYVFAILRVTNLPEKVYKQRITDLQRAINQMRVGKLSPEFYPSAVTFRYESLLQQLNDEGPQKLLDNLTAQVKERLTAGPYFKRGHEAVYRGLLDRAALEFEDALRYVPDSWYGYKHLAEVRMLQGTEKSIELAIEKCREALKLNADYASAHCLLADCLSYQGKSAEALIEYERALALDGTRIAFLTRYGLALAAMTVIEYQKAIEQLQLREPDLARRRNYLRQPWLEAIDKFDQVRRLNAIDTDDPEKERTDLANYHYHRGYAHLQAGFLNQAIEDFLMGRKLLPDDLQLAQAYSYALHLQRKSGKESE